MAVTDANLTAIFTQHLEAAQQMMRDADANVNEAFETFKDKSAYVYEPYEWQIASPPIIGFNPTVRQPIKPAMQALPPEPELLSLPTTIPNPTFAKPASFNVSAPVVAFPPEPSGEPTDTTGRAPTVSTPTFPNSPALLPLPSYALPYPYITIPEPPIINMPVFDGQVPPDMQPITLQEYLDKLQEAYELYAQDIPDRIRSNWVVWFRTMMNENPLIDELVNTVRNYLQTGGSGIPVPIEEAIVTRATDRVASEQRRATLQVYEDVAKRGLTLPGGMLMAGLREARQTSAEAVSKVATDVAIKNLELEHDHMKFMMQIGVQLEQFIMGFASDTGKLVLEANGQALEMVKLVLTGMLQINDAMIKIYLAKWEGYKAAVEVYRAKIAAVEAQIRVYEAEIRAEMAKVEINKATVDILQTIAMTNKAIADVYKTEVDAATARIEADRVRVMAYEASVRAYSVQVEAYKAKWDGYKSRVAGEVAKAQVYEAQVGGYSALINAYKAEIDGYSALTHNHAVQIDAMAKVNDSNLRAWTAQLDGVIRSYVAGIEAYGTEWRAVAEQLRGEAESVRIVADSLFKGYESEARIDTERAHEHLAEWRSKLEATLAAAQGLTQTAHISAQLASSALNGLTSFAGGLATAGAE